MNNEDLDLFIEAMGTDPVAAEEAWKKMSTDARAMIAAVVLRSHGGEVNFKAVSEAGDFHRSAFTENAGRPDQRMANGRRRLLIDHEGIERLVFVIAERAGLDRCEISDRVKVRERDRKIDEQRTEIEKHERLNEAAPKYVQIMRRNHLEIADRNEVNVAPVHGDEVNTSFNDRLNARRNND